MTVKVKVETIRRSPDGCSPTMSVPYTIEERTMACQMAIL